ADCGLSTNNAVVSTVDYSACVLVSCCLFNSSSILSGNEALLANQISGFDGLRIEIQRLSRLFRRPNQQGETEVITNLRHCVQSAGQFVSSASTIVSARSTIA